MITGGKVTFKTPSGFEHKSASVEITFDNEADLDRAAALAQSKALQMIAVKLEVGAPVAAKTEPTAPAVTPVTPEKAPRTPRAPKKPVTTETAPTTAAATPEAVAKALTALDDLPADKPQISTGEERVNPAEIQDEFPDTVAEITDEQLDKIGHAFINSGVPGAGKKIRDLRDEWTGKPGQPLRTLPKEKRQAFVDALGKLT